MSNATIILDGADALMKRLDMLRPENPTMKKDLRKMMREAIAPARKAVSADARQTMRKDPRRASTAVRHSLYKRVLGGQVNILSSRKVKKMQVTIKKKKLKPGQVGGNRRKRSARTNQIDGYMGKDRGFILRFINKGAYYRQIKPTAGSKNPNKAGFGYRGSIETRRWFGPSALRHMKDAEQRFGLAVGDAVEKLWNK